MPRVQVQDLVVEFPGVRALDRVSLEFQPGVVHGIIGENGAGKSTLMRVLAGLQFPTSGFVIIEGCPVALRSVRDSISHGISMIHQELNLVDELTVAENIFLGKEIGRFGLLDKAEICALAEKSLARVGARISSKTLVGKLSIAQKQLVEIAKALSDDASLLIMDEPTAVLTEHETADLFALIRQLRESGVGVLYISHRLNEVEAVCDTVTVMRDGRVVGTFEKGALSQAEMAAQMVGRPLGDLFPAKVESARKQRVLKTESLCGDPMPLNASIELYEGEIVGFAGLVGSGRTEFAETLVGLRKKLGGSVELFGSEAKLHSVRASSSAGLAYVSEDRKGAGLILPLSVIQNVTLPNVDAYAHPFLDAKLERRAAERWMQSLSIKAARPESAVMFLSGGNQQKVAIAKWLELKPKILILDEPTRGVDIGAKREIYDLIVNLAAEGMACIVISSEMTELVGLCHKVYVFREGRIVGSLAGDAITEQAIMTLAAGVAAA
jgi:ribose transport system ATP-binding protein